MADIMRTATATWRGDLQSGAGSMRTGSGSFEGPFSFATRFGQGEGTNPEELIAAAHAGCFSMAASNGLAKAGFPVERFDTTATVHLGDDGAGAAIMKIELVTEAVVPGIDEAAFQTIVTDAKKKCPVSKALAAVPIELRATLRPN